MLAKKMFQDDKKVKENAKKIFEKIFQRCIRTKYGNCSEGDTITKFIHPLLKAFGWDILDFNDMREEVFVKPEGKERHIDLVLYINEKPYIGMEIKSLSYGSIVDDSKEYVQILIKELREKSGHLDVQYAILARFCETIIFDPKTGKKIASFNSPSEHREKFEELWKYLSKPK